MEEFKPRRLRIVDPAMAHYSGPMGLAEFENGVSTAPVNFREAARLGAILRIEDADEPGMQVSPAAEMIRHPERTADHPTVQAVDSGRHVMGEMIAERYGRAELEDIADRRGLHAVREIARRWGRTGRAIKECIDAILDAQDEVDRVANEPRWSPADK